MIRRVSHDPGECHAALAGTGGPVVIDTETTGVQHHDRIVSVGILVDAVAYVLFLRSLHISITNHSKEDFRHALQPLTRRDLTAVFHNANFDLAMLAHEGVAISGPVYDTMKMLRLVDPDRRRDRPGIPRIHRTGEQENYRLKDAVRHLGICTSPSIPGRMAVSPYREHARYLCCDLVATRRLYDWLLARMNAADRSYHSRLIAPLTPILVGMSTSGVQADAGFIESESNRLLALMQQISEAHSNRFGQRLDAGDPQIRHWVYSHGLRCRVIRTGKQRLTSLRIEHLTELRTESTDPATRESLALIADYKTAQSLMIRLKALAQHVQHDGRIRATFNDTQSSGRVSATRPNLQQIAGEVATGRKKAFTSEKFGNEIVRSRNAIVASPGYTLVACDVAQADIRVLAHAVDSFLISGATHLRRLQQARLRRMSRRARRLFRELHAFMRPHNVKPKRPEPGFVPAGCGLADDFRAGSGDFYSVAAQRMLGRAPKDKTERNHLKQTILGIVNGMSAAGLARRLGVSHSQAAAYLQRFAEAYPEVDAYTRLQHESFAITGIAETFAGRRRRVTPHWWLANRRVVDLFVSYRGADKLWVRVIPLRPSRHVLTCYVIWVRDARYGSYNEGKEIYHHKAGRISKDPAYKFLNDRDLLYRLPYRNIPWRIIRRVRTKREEAVYDGFDSIRRSLFNHIAQGGTADVVKLMMIRSEPVCQRFGARLLLQIHDELVWEVPSKKAGPFLRAVVPVLQSPPSADFRVPIVVEPKWGAKLGELSAVPTWVFSSCFLVRFIRRLWAWAASRVRAGTPA